jgi:alpha-glucosidase (family GH31 glycosyl hydrolase)
VVVGCAVACGGLGLASPAHGADRLSVSSGSLSAIVTASPWSVRFTQSSGAELATLPAADGTSYGSLGFSSNPTPPWGGGADAPAGPGWSHATRALSLDRQGSGVVARVLTDDPAGRQLQVVISPSGDGTIAVQATIAPDAGPGAAGVTQMAQGFASPAGEHFSGFGGRENAVDQAGHTVETWSEEGAWVPGDRPFIPPFIEPWTYSTRDDGSYFPMPWMVSSRGYGFLLDDPQRSLFRLRSDRPDAWSVEVDAPSMRYRVFGGPAPLDVVRRFSATVGRQPAPAAPWVLGPWWQPTGASEADLPGQFRKLDIPGSLIQTYTHYLPHGGQDDTAEKAMVNRLHAAGYAVTTYFNPMITEQYQPTFSDAQAAGALLDNRAGQPYLIHYNQYVVAQFDFTAPAGRSFYQRLLGEAIANGYDGWMEDFGEYTPPDSVAADGTPGSALHNPYPRLYHCTAYALASRAGRPIVQFDRSGATGSARCSPVVWSGDPTTDWSFDGLPGMATLGISYGYSGVGLYGSDIGGYFSITAPPTSPELLNRWLELGAFSGVMRTESEGFVTPNWSQSRAQIWDPAVEPIWRRYAKLRTQLYPYIAQAAATYQADGTPIMEGLGLAFPQDQASWTGPPRYLFGPDLLVAPVTAPGVSSLDVPLPAGHWRNLWQAVSYNPSDGSFHLRSAPSLPGDHSVRVATPLEEIPVFVRDGAMLGLLPADVATLAPFGNGVVHLADRAGHLHLLAWPAGHTQTIALGTHLVSDLAPASWTLRVTGTAPTTIAIEATLPFTPTTVTFAAHTLNPSQYRFAGGVLSVTVSGLGLLHVTTASAPARCPPLRVGLRTRHGRIVLASVYENGRLVSRVRGRSLHLVTIPRLAGHRRIVVRVVAVTERGGRIVSTRTYQGCAKGPRRTQYHPAKRSPHRRQA